MARTVPDGMVRLESHSRVVDAGRIRVFRPGQLVTAELALQLGLIDETDFHVKRRPRPAGARLPRAWADNGREV